MEALPVLRRSLLGIGAIAAVLTIFYALIQQVPSAMADSTDVVFIAVSGGVSAYAFSVIREMRGAETNFPHFEEKLRRALLGIFLAVFFWFMGETVWGIYEVVLHIEIPYPSLADVFYLAGYAPALLSTATFILLFRRMITAPRAIATSLIGLCIIGIVSVFLLHPLATSSSGALTKALDLAYPFLDTALLVMVVMILLGFSGLEVAGPWRWIFVGFLFSSAADMMFSWGTLTGWYYSGHPVELLWLYGYLAFATGFKQQRKELHRLTHPNINP